MEFRTIYRVYNVDSPLDFGGAKVLLVEDNQVNQMVASTMLQKMNCIVETAGNGIEAIELVTTRIFDIIFMDCQMPEMDGYEATLSIKNKMKNGDIPNIPIVALTAHAMQVDKEKCLAVGMDDYISKPVREADLAKALSYWLNNSGPVYAEKVIEVPSLQKLQELMGSAFPDLVKMYITNAETAIKNMEDAVSNNDAYTVSLNAHTIKSPSLQMGARKVANVASDIERAAKEANIPLCSELLLAIKGYFVEAREELKQYI